MRHDEGVEGFVESLACIRRNLIRILPTIAQKPRDNVVARHALRRRPRKYGGSLLPVQLRQTHAPIPFVGPDRSTPLAVLDVSRSKSNAIRERKDFDVLRG
jgi:hypothetical protein